MAITQIRYNSNMEPIITVCERPIPDDKAERKIVAVVPEEKERNGTTEPHKVIVNPDGKVSIIILAWNQLSYTRICIDSIKSQTKRDKYNLIVVDQGSTDKTMNYLRKAVDGPDDMIIRNIKNRGFSGGNNQGIQVADSEYILLLNNDCEILKEGWLDQLLDVR